MARKADTPCAECGKLLWSSSTSLPDGERRCRPCRTKDLGERPTICASCGNPFESIRTKKTWTKTCNKSCARRLELSEQRHPFWSEQTGKGRDPDRYREKWQQSNRRRRARKRGVASEAYTLAEIAERDGFRCGICRHKVTMTVRAPKSGSPSIDHIVPLALGGDDLRTNVQLAHRGCNVRKNADLGTGVQLRLVG